MESSDEENVLIDVTWNKVLVDRMDLWISRSHRLSVFILIFFKAVGPVQDVPTAQGPTVVTSMRLTPSSSYAASEVGPPNLILKGLGALSEKDAVVVGPLHVKGLSPSVKGPNQRSRWCVEVARGQGNLDTATKPLLRIL